MNLKSNFPSYLCIGHICMDQDNDNNFHLGGSASYAALLANKMGSKTALLTCFGPDFKFVDSFDELELINTGSDTTTIFQNQYVDEHRSLNLLSLADQINLDKLDDLIDSYDIIHICPIANELDIKVLNRIPNNKLCLITPQGWLRCWNEFGKVSFQKLDWKLLNLSDFVIISNEDVPDFKNEQKSICKQIDKLVVTKGKNGASIYIKGHENNFPTIPVNAVDPTGAGDIFAVAFILKYYETKDISLSMEYANKIAAKSVMCEGVNLVYDYKLSL